MKNLNLIKKLQESNKFLTSELPKFLKENNKELFNKYNISRKMIDKNLNLFFKYAQVKIANDLNFRLTFDKWKYEDQEYVFEEKLVKNKLDGDRNFDCYFNFIDIDYKQKIIFIIVTLFEILNEDSDKVDLYNISFDCYLSFDELELPLNEFKEKCEKDLKKSIENFEII